MLGDLQGHKGRKWLSLDLYPALFHSGVSDPLDCGLMTSEAAWLGLIVLNPRKPGEYPCVLVLILSHQILKRDALLETFT